MSTILQLPQTAPQSRQIDEPTPQQRAAALVAQAWAELGEVQGPKARQMCATLRDMVPQIERLTSERMVGQWR